MLSGEIILLANVLSEIMQAGCHVDMRLDEFPIALPHSVLHTEAPKKRFMRSSVTFAFKQRQQIRAINIPIRRNLGACCGESCSGYVKLYNRLIKHASSLKASFPVGNKRHVNATFPNSPFSAAQSSVVNSSARAAIITQEKDQRVFLQSAFTQTLHNATYNLVKLRHVSGVSTAGGRQRALLPTKPGFRRHKRSVNSSECHIEQKRLISVVVDKFKRLITESFHVVRRCRNSDFVAVSRRRSFAMRTLRAEAVRHDAIKKIKTALIGSITVTRADMPLANHAGGVAKRLHTLRKSYLIYIKRARAAVDSAWSGLAFGVGVKSQTLLIPAGDQTGSRWTANAT
jgi:hypothetical protein